MLTRRRTFRQIESKPEVKGIDDTDGGERSVTPGAAANIRQALKGATERRTAARYAHAPLSLQGFISILLCRTQIISGLYEQTDLFVPTELTSRERRRREQIRVLLFRSGTICCRGLRYACPPFVYLRPFGAFRRKAAVPEYGEPPSRLLLGNWQWRVGRSRRDGGSPYGSQNKRGKTPKAYLTHSSRSARSSAFESLNSSAGL